MSDFQARNQDESRGTEPVSSCCQAPLGLLKEMLKFM